MAVSPKIKKITLDPYVLVLFVERVFAEPKRKGGKKDKNKNSRKKEQASSPSLN